VVQNFTILVTRFANGDPTITSTPPTTATVSQEYTYQAIATDPENDPLEFDLPVHPAGMAIGRTSGALAWTPANNQVGTSDVVVRVRDVLGGTFLQAYQVNVRDDTNHPPMIVSTPPYPALQNRPYKYQLVVRDPDAADTTFTYGFAATPPSGMTVDAAGLVQWTPSALGNYRIAVKATDPRGAATTQAFVLRVDADPGNRNPVISSTPRTLIRQGALYLYALQASDPDLDPLTYTVTLPAGATGMVYDATNRLIKWPVAGAIGSYGPIQVSVTDGRGGSASQSYTLVGRPGTATGSR
jgi:hypothetical protein